MKFQRRYSFFFFFFSLALDALQEDKSDKRAMCVLSRMDTPGYWCLGGDKSWDSMIDKKKKQ